MFVVNYRLGESEGSYCTLATFPSDSLSLSPSSPTSPLSIEKSKKQIRQHHQRLPYELTKFQRNMSFTNNNNNSSSSCSSSTTSSTSVMSNASAATALRMRQMAFNMATPNRPHPQWRCDRQSYHPVPPTSYHHYGAANRYMQRNYKNVLTV